MVVLYLFLRPIGGGGAESAVRTAAGDRIDHYVNRYSR